MLTFELVNQHSLPSDQVQTITPLHFGGNLLLNYDEILNPNSELRNGFDSLSVQNLRFPGGAVTEQYFDISNPNATTALYHGHTVELVPLNSFFKIANDLGMSATIVIPTIDGFTESAAQSILGGTYGYRQVDAYFVEAVTQFVIEAIQLASEENVRVEAFEIGNEFWGSGEMTAAEYGRLAARMAVAVETGLLQAGISTAEQPMILVQGIAAAGLYSPTPISSNTIYVYEMSDGSLWSTHGDHNVGDAPSEFSNLTVERDFGPYELENQGFIGYQNRQIVSEITKVVGAANAIDGLVLHYYGDASIAEIDTTDQSIFNAFTVLKELERSRSEDLPDLNQYVTEWNIRGRNTHPNQGDGGAIHAAYLVEMFFEMVTNGIDAAHVWPIRNEGAQLSSMLDVDGDGLSIAGEAFRMMSELLIGLTPSLDFEQSNGANMGHIDVHGFSSENRDVLFVSERGGIDGIQTLDISEVTQGRDFFFSVEVLWTDGDPFNPNSEPITNYFGLSLDQVSSTIDLLLQPYSLASVEITYISDGDDLVYGRGGDDFILGRAGNDELHGRAGDDTLRGGSGNDTLFGNDGADFLQGFDGDDVMIGGAGSDAYLGGSGDDLIIIDEFDFLVNGGDGFDILSLADYSFGVQIWFGPDVVERRGEVSLSFSGIESIVGTEFGDGIASYRDLADLNGAGGADFFQIFQGVNVRASGGQGNDTFFVYHSEGAQIEGGSDDDEIRFFSGDATIDAGKGDDSIFIFGDSQATIIFSRGDGNDTISSFDFQKDSLGLFGFSASEFSIETRKSGTLVHFSSTDSIFFHGVQNLSTDDFYAP